MEQLNKKTDTTSSVPVLVWAIRAKRPVRLLLRLAPGS